MNLKTLPLFVALVCTPAFAGGKKAGGPSASDCDAMMKHLVDLAVNDFLSDPDNKDMSSSEKAAAAVVFKNEFQKDEEYRSMKKECRAFTKQRVDCSLKAKTLDGLDKCEG